jgi:oxygen-independent coproporphyrinogen-3 oxidase
MLELPPLSLYIHIPWCVRKCPYCDFNSHEHGGRLPEPEYLKALLADLRSDLPLAQGRSLQSIFIGGGTPSLLSGKFYRELLDAIASQLTLANNLECTLEANPGTVEVERFAAYRNAGINRLSLGIQSFDDAALAALGRIHDSQQALHAIASVRQAGFDNFNLDIMFALPDQSLEQALADLERAIAQQPTHLSWYQLTIEPNTAFYRRPPPLPDEETVLAIMAAGTGLLAGAGLQRYETSAYARAGRQSRHNLNYWRFGDYLGIGAGASGKVTCPESGQFLRYRKVRQPNHYLARTTDFLAESIPIEADALDLEFMMNALRLIEGFELSLYQRRTGKSFSGIRKKLEYLESEGLLRLPPGQVVPTGKGRLFVNNLLEQFF